MTSTTSRRALLTAAAAVPAIALLPATSSAIAAVAPTAKSAEQAVDPVIALAERVIQADAALGEACEAFNPFEDAFFEWRRKNPSPVILAGRIGDTDDPTSVYAKNLSNWLLDDTAQADYIAANEEYVAAMKKWTRRERAKRWFRLSEQNLRVDKWSVCQC